MCVDRGGRVVVMMEAGTGSFLVPREEDRGNVETDTAAAAAETIGYV